jgi:hypothetical protein
VPTLVESFAATLGWKVCECNVIVEGTSDVAVFWLAAGLYYEKHQTAILGDRITVLAAGKGNDGGVDGVNRRLHAARQIADVDRDKDGRLRFRFIGLYDNDRADRRAIDVACTFDRRLLRYADLFLLHPVMPAVTGLDHVDLRRQIETENAQFKGLDWEIEDLLSERMLLKFESQHGDAIERVQECGGRKHRDFTRDGKARLHKFMSENASLDDLLEVVKLIRALRGYLRLKANHIVC